MLFGSWKYIERNQNIFFERNEVPNLLDLFVFYDERIHDLIPVDCRPFRFFGTENDPDLMHSWNSSYFEYAKKMKATYDDREQAIIFRSACWKIPIVFNNKHKFTKMFNSFQIYHREGLQNMFRDHDFVLHTTTDTFLTPGLFTFDFNIIEISVGLNLKCDQSRMSSLKQMAEKLKTHYAGIRCFKHSLLARRDKAIHLLQKSFMLSNYLLKNEIQTVYINPKIMRSEAKSTYIDTYTMELLLNHGHDDYQLSKDNQMYLFLDVSSCSKLLNIRKALTISSRNTKSCKTFSKTFFFGFFANLQTMLQKERLKFIEHTTRILTRDEAHTMSAADFAQFISQQYAVTVLEAITETQKTDRK
jgi:hypothetical protein